MNPNRAGGNGRRRGGAPAIPLPSSRPFREVPKPGYHRAYLEELLAHLGQGHACTAMDQYVQAVSSKAVNDAAQDAPLIATPQGPQKNLRVDLGAILEEPEHLVYVVRLHAEHAHEAAFTDELDGAAWYPKHLHREDPLFWEVWQALEREAQEAAAQQPQEAP